MFTSSRWGRFLITFAFIAASVSFVTVYLFRFIPHFSATKPPVVAKLDCIALRCPPALKTNDVFMLTLEQQAVAIAILDKASVLVEATLLPSRKRCCAQARLLI